MTESGREASPAELSVDGCFTWNAFVSIYGVPPELANISGIDSKSGLRQNMGEASVWNVNL